MFDRTSRRLSGTLIAGGALVAGTAGFALAATPGEGTVSHATPQVAWKGTVAMSYFNRIPVLVTGDGSVPCAPESCDAFTLHVADADDLVVAADATDTSDGTPASVTLRVTKPDGSVTVFTATRRRRNPSRPSSSRPRPATTPSNTSTTSSARRT